MSNATQWVSRGRDVRPGADIYGSGFPARCRSASAGGDCTVLSNPPPACNLLRHRDVVFQLPPNLAAGLILMAASPGGAMANILSRFADGDLALNLTLTASNAMLAIITLPLILAVNRVDTAGA